MAYYNPHTTGLYNPHYTANNQGFVHCSNDGPLEGWGCFSFGGGRRSQGGDDFVRQSPQNARQK